MDAVQTELIRVLLKCVYKQGLISEGTYSSALEKVSIAVDGGTPSRYNVLPQKGNIQVKNDCREGNAIGCAQGKG